MIQGSKLLKVKYLWRELIRIETELNRITYKGVPLGGLFGNMLYSNLYITGFEFTLWIKFRIYLQFIKTPLLSFLKFKSEHIYEKKKFIFNYTANLNKLTSFFSPLLAYIDNKDVLFVSRKNEYFNGNPEFDFYTPPTLSLREWLNWKKEFKPVFDQFKEMKPGLKSKFNIDGILYLHLKIILIHQTQRLYSFVKLLHQVNPRVILTDHDRQAINSALMIAAKIKPTKTYTFIHGNADPEANFIPLLADYMFCWGPKHVDQFSKKGIKNERLLIVGNPTLPFLDNIQSPDISSKIRVTLITNPIHIDERLILARCFAEAVHLAKKVDPRVTGLVKLHPSESKHEYQTLIREYPKITFLTSNEISNEELFRQSSIVVSHNSTLGLDALVNHKPVIVLNHPNVYFPLGMGKVIVEHAGSSEAKNEIELASFISDEIRNIELHIENKKVNDFLSYYNSYWGDESARKIFEAISN